VVLCELTLHPGFQIQKEKLMTRTQDWILAVVVFVVGGIVGALVASILPDWVAGSVTGLVYSVYWVLIRPRLKRRGN
jgi:hypothetical protein